MTVKELIADLEKIDGDLKVFGYSSLGEEGGDIGGVSVRTKFPYVGGDIDTDGPIPAEFALLYI
jgi:hypothetical protein